MHTTLVNDESHGGWSFPSAPPLKSSARRFMRLLGIQASSANAAIFTSPPSMRGGEDASISSPGARQPARTAVTPRPEAIASAMAFEPPWAASASLTHAPARRTAARSATMMSAAAMPVAAISSAGHQAMGARAVGSAPVAHARSVATTERSAYAGIAGVGQAAPAEVLTRMEMVGDVCLVAMWGAMIPGMLWLGHLAGY